MNNPFDVALKIISLLFCGWLTVCTVKIKNDTIKINKNTEQTTSQLHQLKSSLAGFAPLPPVK